MACWLSEQPAFTLSSLVSKLTIDTFKKIFWCKKLLPDICLLSELSVLNKTKRPPIVHTIQLIWCWQGRLKASFLHALTAKQPRLKSGGLQNVVRALQSVDQGRRQTVIAYLHTHTLFQCCYVVGFAWKCDYIIHYNWCIVALLTVKYVKKNEVYIQVL